MKPGVYDFEPITRGDTFVSRAFAQLSKDGVALGVTSARLQVREKESSKPILEWRTSDGSMTLSGASNSIITLAEKSAAIMATKPVGSHRYDLEVTLTGGRVLTVLAGIFPISADISR